MTKKPSAKTRFLSMLREAGPRGVTTSEILQAGIGNRFTSRLFDLRHKDGHTIHAERICDGAWCYVLVHDAERDAERGSDLGTTRSLPASQAGVTLGAPTGAPGAAASALKDAPPSVPVLAAPPLFDVSSGGGYADWDEEAA